MTSTPVDVDHVVITAEKLQQKIALGRDVVILEVRREARADDAVAQRIPGAHAVTAADFTGTATDTSGTYPLPTDEQIQLAVRRWGIGADSLVVTYSPENPAFAARAWWTLRWAGVPDVRYLDGGAEAWTAAGGTLAADNTRTTAATGDEQGTFVVRTGSLPVLDADAAATLARSGVLLDARGAQPYGEGHIPGAGHLAGASNLTQNGRLRDDEALRTHYQAAGVTPDGEVGSYCGAGIAAALNVLALTKIGVPSALYPGSFSEYRTVGTRPVATGNEPG